MKLRTIVNKVTDGSITSVTIEVFEETNLLEIDIMIDYGVATIVEMRTCFDNYLDCLDLVKEEMKNRGIFSIKYKDVTYSIDSFELNE